MHVRIAITVPGRLHAFSTAAELEQRGHLRKVITPLPYFRIRKHSHLAPAYFSTEWLHAGYRALFHPLAASAAKRASLEAVDGAIFDWCARNALPSDIDLCIGYAGACLHTLRRARALGAKTVVERHSAHRASQMELLAEEHELIGLPFHSDPGLMRRELLEYSEADAICVPGRFVERTFLEQGFPREKLVRVPLAST